MIGSVAAYLTQTADSIARREVDAKLHSLAARLCIEPADPELVSQAIALLGARVETLHAAAEDVERVRVSLAHLATVLKFAEERWNARRTEISELLLRDTMAGIQAIVGDWFEAVTHGHLEAAARLSSVDLPDGLEVLSARLAVATNALNASNWEAAAGFLRLGSRGIDLGDPAQRVPEATIRGDTQALLVRLALQQGLQDEAEAALGALEGGPEAAALRRRLARLRGEAEATSPLEFSDRRFGRQC